MAQLPSGGGASKSEDDSTNFKFVPVPYINYNRATGFALGAVPMAMYKVNKNDTHR